MKRVLVPVTITDFCALELRQKREALGMEQGVAAKACGLVQSALSRAESGSVPLTVEMFARICNVYNVTPSKMMRRAEAAYARHHYPKRKPKA